ncbi:hypothetical protein [Nocardioides sp. Iso805N]|uniref:hypothetical protein n=1 Tax=Nocardioides sp. Iso805N TaxID=1283287 RepID=UPI0003725CC5|nr:hypothetical protein [Nocardioides sp. Iso805N]
MNDLKAESAPPEGEPLRGRTPPRGTLLTVALVLLAGAGLWHGVRQANDDSAAPDGELSSATARAEIMAQAGKLAATAMSYRAAQADQDIAAAEKLMTPAMRKKYERGLPPAADRAQQAKAKVTVKASVASLSGKDGCQGGDCAVSIVSAAEDRARVLVFVDRAATSTNSKDSVASPTWALLTLVNQGGGWLIDDMASA